MIDWMFCPSRMPVKAVKINPMSSSSGGFFNTERDEGFEELRIEEWVIHV